MKPLPTALRLILIVAVPCFLVALVGLSCGPGQMRSPLEADSDAALGKDGDLKPSDAPGAANKETVLRLSMPWTDPTLNGLKAADVRITVFGGAQNSSSSLIAWTTDVASVAGGSTVSDDGQFIVDLTLSSLEEWLKHQGAQICLRLEFQRRSDGRPVANTPVSCIDR